MLNLFKVLAHKFNTCKACGWVKYYTNRHTVGRCYVTALLNWCQAQHSPRSRVVEEVYRLPGQGTQIARILQAVFTLRLQSLCVLSETEVTLLSA